MCENLIIEGVGDVSAQAAHELQSLVAIDGITGPQFGRAAAKCDVHIPITVGIQRRKYATGLIGQEGVIEVHSEREEECSRGSKDRRYLRINVGNATEETGGI